MGSLFLIVLVMKKIPSVDLSHFVSGSIEKKESFVKALANAFETIGFVALNGHSLSPDMQQALYEQVSQFFSFPQASKNQYIIKGGGGQRGYTAFGKEHAKGQSKGDLKEFWHFGQEIANDESLKQTYPANIVVTELPEFNSVGMKVFKELERIALKVLQALAIHLGLEDHYFNSFVQRGNSILRAIHYPPITSPPEGAVRAAAHGDINLITLLMGAQGSGLQVQNHQGEWIEASADKNALIINTGDMLSRLTNNKLKSTLHRVVNPPKEFWDKPRYSIPFFMHPIPEMDLTCLPQCVDEAHPKQYEDITAGQFLTLRLHELGLLKN